MPVVFIPAPWRDLTGGITHLDLEGPTVGDVLAALDAQFPGILARATRDDALVPGLQVAVDGVMTRRGLRTDLRPNSEVHFLPVIGGG
jgi:sulfur-carrier protein